MADGIRFPDPPDPIRRLGLLMEIQRYKSAQEQQRTQNELRIVEMLAPIADVAEKQAPTYYKSLSPQAQELISVRGEMQRRAKKQQIAQGEQPGITQGAQGLGQAKTGAEQLPFLRNLTNIVQSAEPAYRADVQARLGAELAAPEATLRARAQQMRQDETIQAGFASAADLRNRARANEQGLTEEGAVALAGAIGDPGQELAVENAYAELLPAYRIPEMRARAMAERVKLLKTQQGMTGEQAVVEAEFQDLQERARYLDPEGGRVHTPTGYRQPTRNDAILADKRLLFEYGGELYMAPVAKTNKARYEREVFQTKAFLAAMEDVQAAYTRVSTKQARGEILSVGPLRPKSFQDILRFTGWGGGQDPDVAQFLESSFLAVADLLKAKQGSRPSDFDFKNYLSIRPRLTEFGTPQGFRRLEVMRGLASYSLLALVDPESARAIKAQVSRGHARGNPEADAELDAAYRQWRSAVLDENGEYKVGPEEVGRATADLMDAAEKWDAAGGAEAWTPESQRANPNAAVDPAMKSILNEMGVESP